MNPWEIELFVSLEIFIVLLIISCCLIMHFVKHNEFWVKLKVKLQSFENGNSFHIISWTFLAIFTDYPCDWSVCTLCIVTQNVYCSTTLLNFLYFFWLE